MAEIGEILINLIWMFLKGEEFEGIWRGIILLQTLNFILFL